MLDLLSLLVADSPAPAAPGGFLQMLPLILGVFLIMYLMVIRPQKKQQAERQQMLNAVKKNDRVLTTGGIYGVVMALNGDEVTLKIDDQNNVRVRFARSAIASVISKDEEGAAAPAIAEAKK